MFEILNRINEKGTQLIQYKEELLKDYPQIVRDSLVLALEQMVENEVVDLDTFNIMVDKSINTDTFREYLLSKPTFSKTEEEIFKEFEIIREELMKKLEANEMEDMFTESVPEKDVIVISKKFCIGEAFTMKYFGVEEKDLLKLMKRRGFVEKFAVLRLTAIFNNVIKLIPMHDNLFKTDVSLVYFDKDENGYSIDLFYEVDIKHFEKEEKIQTIIDSIKDSKLKAEEIYNQKTLY